MHYLLYLIVGPWVGKWALFASATGLCLLFSARLTQPIHGFNLKRIVEFLLLSSAIIAFIWVFKLGTAPISASHWQELQALANTTPNGGTVIKTYSQQSLTEIDFFALRQKLKRMGHPHFLHSKQLKTIGRDEKAIQ